VSEAVIDEVKKFREEKIEAQKKLREVRRNLRGDIEDLGNTLFLINTFAVPLFLIIFVFYRYNRRKKISRKA
jgi:ABC-type uncharacterized transport system involved in gliding motility auxiliary subunit